MHYLQQSSFDLGMGLLYVDLDIASTADRNCVHAFFCSATEPLNRGFMVLSHLCTIYDTDYYYSLSAFQTYAIFNSSIFSSFYEYVLVYDGHHLS